MKNSTSVRRIVLSLGSNLGERMENLQGAVDTLFDAPGLELVALSPVYETEPVGGPAQSPFLNAVVVADTDLTADTLLERAQNVEEVFHRVREERWGPRSLDVDLIVVGAEHRTGDRLTLPHPRARERAFVLQPWSDVDAEARIDGLGEIRDLLPELAEQGVRRRDDLILHAPT